MKFLTAASYLILLFCVFFTGLSVFNGFLNDSTPLGDVFGSLLRDSDMAMVFLAWIVAFLMFPLTYFLWFNSTRSLRGELSDREDELERVFDDLRDARRMIERQKDLSNERIKCHKEKVKTLDNRAFRRLEIIAGLAIQIEDANSQLNEYKRRERAQALVRDAEQVLVDMSCISETLGNEVVGIQSEVRDLAGSTRDATQRLSDQMVEIAAYFGIGRDGMQSDDVRIPAAELKTDASVDFSIDPAMMQEVINEMRTTIGILIDACEECKYSMAEDVLIYTLGHLDKILGLGGISAEAFVVVVYCLGYEINDASESAANHGYGLMQGAKDAMPGLSALNLGDEDSKESEGD